MKQARTKTGDIMQVSECSENEVTYGVILIKLKRSYSRLQAAHVLVEFMQQLQPVFAIQHTTGTDVTCEQHQHELTATDYWQDAEKKDWKVKGWSNGRMIAVLYIKNIGHVPVETETLFFNLSCPSGS